MLTGTVPRNIRTAGQTRQRIAGGKRHTKGPSIVLQLNLTAHAVQPRVKLASKASVKRKGMVRVTRVTKMTYQHDIVFDIGWHLNEHHKSGLLVNGRSKHSNAILPDAVGRRTMGLHPAAWVQYGEVKRSLSYLCYPVDCVRNVAGRTPCLFDVKHTGASTRQKQLFSTISAGNGTNQSSPREQVHLDSASGNTSSLHREPKRGLRTPQHASIGGTGAAACTDYHLAKLA